MKHVVFKSLPKTTVISFTVTHDERGVAPTIPHFTGVQSDWGRLLPRIVQCEPNLHHMYFFRRYVNTLFEFTLTEVNFWF